MLPDESVAIPIDAKPLLLYTSGSPSFKLWGFENTIWSWNISNPPLFVVILPSNDNSLNLLPNTGSMMASAPLPPVNLIDRTFSISKSCWSTKTSFNVPFITGWSNAVVPEETCGKVIFGKFMTSKLDPPFKTFTLFKGPK